jgi:hypothetical protein
MITKRSFFGIACRAAAFSFLVAGSASLIQAQESSSVEFTQKAPLLLASATAPVDLTSSSSSSSDSVMASDGRFKLNFDSLNGSQPPPRRRYGRPNYSDSHSNPDGSPKWAFLVGGGLGLPVGNTHKYETPSYGFQVGGGRNFSKTLGIILQFDYDHFGLQGTTLANQQFVENIYLQKYFGETLTGTNLDGSNHVWSFTLDPTFTLATEGSLGAYMVVGGGFYHKVTDFTVPSTQCDPFSGFCSTVNQNFDAYTSNAVGANGGFGLTYKFSKFSNERFYAEARYVFVANQARPGYTSANINSDNNNNTNLYPANSHRTTYIPIKFGLRF